MVYSQSSFSAGHTEAVIAVSFSPDGKSLASGSGDTTVRFWDLSTQTPLFTCKGGMLSTLSLFINDLLQCCPFLKFWFLGRLHTSMVANLILVAWQTTKMTLELAFYIISRVIGQREDYYNIIRWWSFYALLLYKHMNWNLWIIEWWHITASFNDKVFFQPILCMFKPIPCNEHWTHYMNHF